MREQMERQRHQDDLVVSSHACVNLSDCVGLGT